jgi:hypothetical protein
MSQKIYPTTYDGDQISVSFPANVELWAFEKVVDNIKTRIEKNKNRGDSIDDFQFETTLQAEVAGAYYEEIKKIVGLGVFNVYEKERGVHSMIIPLSALK